MKHEFSFLNRLYLGVCPKDTFRCSNGNCISPLLTCDGENNCNDGSDEFAEHCIKGTNLRHFTCIYARFCLQSIDNVWISYPSFKNIRQRRRQALLKNCR